MPSTAEKNSPAKKPGTAKAGSGASQTSKKASHGRPGRRMLAMPIDKPAIAQPNAQVRPIPIAPRIRFSPFIDISPAEFDRYSRLHFVSQSNPANEPWRAGPQQDGAYCLAPYLLAEVCRTAVGREPSAVSCA